MKPTVWHVLTAIVISIVLAAVGYLSISNRTLKTSNVHLAEQKRSIEKELEELYKQKQALEIEFAAAKKEKESLVNKINDYEAKIGEIKSKSEARMRDQEAELNKIKALLAQKEKELPAKDAEINLLKEALKPGNEKIEQLTRKLNKASKKLIKNGAVSLQPITVTAEPKKISGKVLEINRDYGFLVVDVGTKAGVEKGDTLFVLRDNELLGKIIVEKTSYEICAAKILYKSLADAVQKGDSVCN